MFNSKNKWVSYLRKWNLTAPKKDVVDKIAGALKADPRTKSAIIDVIDDQGKIILTGSVHSADVIQAAEEIARQQGGNGNFINEMRVG